MVSKHYFGLAGIVFTIAALLHLFRSVFAWDLILGVYLIPAWISWVAVIFAGYLAYASFSAMGGTHNGKRKKRTRKS